MRLNKRDLEKLRNRLPKGYVDQIIATLKEQGVHCSAGMVSYTLNGVHVNMKVLDAAILVAERHEAEMAELSARMRGTRSRSNATPSIRAQRAQAA